MNKLIIPFNLDVELHNTIYSIGNDFVIFDSFSNTSASDYPYKINVWIAVLCIKGCMKGIVNLKKYVAQSPCIIALNRGQILQLEHVSDDFAGFFLIMSEQFAAYVMENMYERSSLQLAFARNPCLPLSKANLDSMMDYCNMLKTAKDIKDLSIRKEMVKHLILAFYYALTYHSHIFAGYAQQTKQGILTDRFLNLVQENFKEQREIGFYADRLCLTPKYLSKAIKDSSGYSANEWIDNHVILEAKALLKSTGMTIQQISDELNFPSQSFFGKYFKRIVGLSPKEYQKKQGDLTQI